jgi:hypothetical protein
MIQVYILILVILKYELITKIIEIFKWIWTKFNWLKNWKIHIKMGRLHGK